MKTGHKLRFDYRWNYKIMHENLIEWGEQLGFKAYRNNPRWGSRTFGLLVTPLRGTQPLLPKNRYHPLYTSLELLCLKDTMKWDQFDHVIDNSKAHWLHQQVFSWIIHFIASVDAKQLVINFRYCLFETSEWTIGKQVEQSEYSQTNLMRTKKQINRSINQ